MPKSLTMIHSFFESSDTQTDLLSMKGESKRIVFDYLMSALSRYNFNDNQPVNKIMCLSIQNLKEISKDSKSDIL